jgi:hypothetical protein
MKSFFDFLILIFLLLSCNDELYRLGSLTVTSQMRFKKDEYQSSAVTFPVLNDTEFRFLDYRNNVFYRFNALRELKLRV